MNSISSIFSSALSQVESMDGVSSVSSTSAASASSSTSSNGDTTNVSTAGQLISKLKDLEQTDPAQAKQVLEKIASQLQSAAADATGGQATRLNNLAEKFTDAAKTGDLSSLTPPQAPPPGGNRGLKAYSQSQAQSDFSQDDALLETVATSSAS